MQQIAASTHLLSLDIHAIEMNNFFLEQAIRESRAYSNRYFAEHETYLLGLRQKMGLTVPFGRLQFMLEMGRERLFFLISVKDIVALADCYQGYVFAPNRFPMIAPDLCDNLDINFKDCTSSRYFDLVRRLNAHDVFVKAALADLLEQLWCRGISGKSQIAQFCMTRGMRLY